MKRFFYLAFLSLLPAYVAATEPCDSFRDSKGRSIVDCAPPIGFIDVCSRDTSLCTLLTKGYPPSVTTIAYFVPAEDWKRHQTGERPGFGRYLIAQRARTMSGEAFTGFKQYIHEHQGEIPDHTDLPRVFESQGHVPLGVTDETNDSISFGTVMRLAAADSGAGPVQLLASINTVLQMKGETLSLYTFQAVSRLSETDDVKALSRNWLACIRARNAR